MDVQEALHHRIKQLEQRNKELAVQVRDLSIRVRDLDAVLKWYRDGKPGFAEVRVLIHGHENRS